MPTAIAMPRLGMSMREGTVIEWRVAPGQHVAQGDPLLVIESEKAEVEVEAPATGVLRHIYVEPGATVPCGTLLAALTDAADDPFDPEDFRAKRAPAPEAAREAAAPGPVPGAGQAAGAGARVSPPVTPAARRRARELGIDLARIAGSGPRGRVLVEDVEAVAERLASRVKGPSGVALEVRELGSGDPVVCLPGFGADLGSFARVAPELARGHRVVAMNPRGVGVSDAPEAELYRVTDLADDAAALGESAPAHWVGASLGAAVALELAWRHPERVRSLTLITPFLGAEGRLLAVLEAWCRVAEAAPPAVLATVLLPWLFSSRFLSDAAAAERARRGLVETLPSVPAPTLRRTAEGLRAWSGSRSREELGRIAAPVLVVAAGEDLLTPGAEALAEAIPGARSVMVPEAGHAVALEAPETVSEAILQHLDGAA